MNMFNFKAWLLPVITSLFLLSACSDHDDPAPTDPHSVVEIQLSTDITTYPAGITHTIDAVIIYFNGEVTNVTEGVLTWHSDNELVATVNERGEVMGIGPGTTLIVATYLDQDPNISGSISITITEAVIENIEIFPGNKELPLGLNEEYEALGRFSDDTEHYLDKNSDLVWTSSNTAAVTIDATTGLTHTLMEGDTIITASYQNTFNDTVTLHVSKEALTSLTISPVHQAGQTPGEITTVADGYPIYFTALADYTNGVTHNVTNDVVWLSGSEAYLSLGSEKGEFIGAGEGFSDVSATLDDSGVSNIIPVTITRGTLTAIEIQTDDTTIPLGLKYQLEAVGSFTGGNSENISEAEPVSWYTTTPDIVTVNQKGEIKGVAEGLATIKVSVSGSDIDDSQDILISDATLTSSIKVSSLGNDYLATGESMQFIATGTYTDGTEHIIHNDNIAWDLIGDITYILYTGDASIDSRGKVFNEASNTRPVTDVVYVTAYVHDVDGWEVENAHYDSDNVGLAATKILETSTNSTLNFVSPLKQSDANKIGMTTEGYQNYREDGVSGPVDEVFMTVTHELAAIQCEELAYNKFNDYRLPTYDELKTLWAKYNDDTDGVYTLYTEQKWSVGQYFWTSTMLDDAADENGATYKLVDLREGQDQPAALSSSYHYVSCVRDNLLP
jgi:hypothetical protein